MFSISMRPLISTLAQAVKIHSACPSRKLWLAASMHAGVANLIHDGKDGFILRQVDDFQRLAQLLRQLHEDEILRTNAGDAAAETARQWTWDRHADDVWELLKDAVGKKLLSPGQK